MARYPIKVLLDENRVPFIPYLPSDAVVVNGSNKTVADQITDLHTEINERLSTVYDFKGSVTFENLPITGQKTGDVYDITNDFILNDQKYPAGTNLAWATDHWDPLAGILNIKTVYKKLDLSVAIMPTVSSINGYAFTIEANKAEWLKMINDAVKASEQYVDFVTTKDDGYTFRLYILNTTDGTQNCNMMIYTPPYLLYNLHYADTYWYNKTVKITFADGVATNITVQTGSGYSYREWLFPQFRNTTAFTPTADTHLATKKYVDDGLSLKEVLVNKITSLLSTSTDTEYPSAKAVYDYISNNKIYELPIHTQADPLIIDTLEPGLYINTIGGNSDRVYYKAHAADTTVNVVADLYTGVLYVSKKLTDVVIPQSGLSEAFAYFYGTFHESAYYEGALGCKTFKLDTNGTITVQYQGGPGSLVTGATQIFNGIKAFNTVPELNKNVTDIVQPFHIPNKKYVDYYDIQGINKIESSYPLSVIDNTGNLMYDIAHDTNIMTPITALVNKAYKTLGYTTGPLYFYNIYEDNIYYKIEMDLNKSDLANHNKIVIKPVYTASLLQRLNTGKGYWTEAVFTTNSYSNSTGFSKFVYDATTGISGDILNVLVTNNMEPYTPTLAYAPANKKYVDDLSSSVQTQYATMPTASADNLGKIVQYTGATNQNYTNGYFYQVVSDGALTPTYSWEEIQFGGGGGGSGDTNCGYYYIELGANSYMVYGQTYMSFYLDATDQARLAAIIEDALGKGNKAILLNVKQNYGTWTYRLHLEGIDLTQSTTYFAFQQVLCAGDVNELAYSLYSEYGTQQVIVACTVTNGHITAMSYNRSDANTMGKYLPIGNTSAFTPTASYDPVPKKYVDDAIKGTDLSNDLELEDPTAAVSLMKVRYANIGDSFSLSYIIAATADTHGTVFITKIPSAHFYKTIPTTHDYHPIGAVTYFEYDSVAGDTDPKPAYGYTRFSDTDPDWVRIVIYPMNYDGNVGIKAQSYFYVDFNWIRI